jgi:hypothetical protein
MTMTLSVRLAAWVAVVCMAGAACTSTTQPTDADSGITPLVFNTETFAATLQAKGNNFYSFFVAQAGPVGLTLAAVQAPGGGALSTPLGIGVGIPSGVGCARSTSQTVPPGLAAQLTVTLNPGTYCAAVFDSGNLTSAVNFAMRIRHP